MENKKQVLLGAFGALASSVMLYYLFKKPTKKVESKKLITNNDLDFLGLPKPVVLDPSIHTKEKCLEILEKVHLEICCNYVRLHNMIVTYKNEG